MTTVEFNNAGLIYTYISANIGPKEEPIETPSLLAPLLATAWPVKRRD